MELAPAPWTLRPYQVEALRAISTAWQSVDRTLLVLATGLGKTSVAAEIARRRAAAGRGRTLFLAHRIELLTQAAERMRLGGLGAHLESGDYRAPLHQCETLEPAHVVVATVQTLRGKRLEQWAPDAFGTIIVDEAHHATAASYRAVLDRFPAAKILGLTATPDRGDGVALGGVIDHLAYEYSLRQGIEGGYLSPIRVLGIDTPTIDMSRVRTTKQEHGRDFSADDLAEQMASNESLHALAAPIAKESGNRPTIVFVPSVKTAHALAEVLAAYVGHDQVESLDGTASAEERASVLARYQQQKCRILVNCALFTEGFDAPHTSCIAMCRPTKSRALYAQAIGRGTRLSCNKTDCLVLDMAPSNARHSLVAPVDLLAGRELDDDAQASARARMGAVRSDGESEAQDILAAAREAEEQSAANAMQRALRRREAHVIAEVAYGKRQRDPFAELDIDGALGSERGPRARPAMLQALSRAGIDVGDVMPSIGEAKALLAEVARRREEGLCTVKQSRVLGRAGLRRDLSFADAQLAIADLVANDWRTSPSLAERFGAA